MGTEKLFEKLKLKGKIVLACGLLLTLLGGLPLFCFIVAEMFDSSDMVLYLIFVPTFLLGLHFDWIAVRYIKHPERTLLFKKRPELIAMAEELFNNLAYEDDYVYISPRVIASKRDLTQMAYFNEILSINEYVMTVDRVVRTSHKILLHTEKGDVAIGVYGCGKEKLGELTAIIREFWHNA